VDILSVGCILTDNNPSDHLAITCYFEVQICSEKGHGDANPKKKMCWEKRNIAGYEHALA